MTDDQALDAVRDVARLEGIIPALETAHALHVVLREPSDSDMDLVCFSGRGDKDLAEVMDRLGGTMSTGVGAHPVAGAARIEQAFAAAPGRAALMPYLMGGYPDVGDVGRDRPGLCRRRRRPGRARRAVLRSDRRRAGDPGRGDAALAARRRASRTCWASQSASRRASRSC